MQRLPAMVPLLAALLVACRSAPSQLPAVESLVARSRLVRIACLDANNDRRIDAADAEAGPLPDITGDGVFDRGDRDVLREIDLALPEGKPATCEEGQPAPDWQVSPPPQVDCRHGKGGLLIVGVGGGAVELSNLSAAAGTRWMLAQIGEELSEQGIPHQLVSVAPGLGGTARPQEDAETWATAYLSAELERQPCLQAILLGHSHGGALVTAVAARLEEAGLGDRLLLTIPLDRVTALYAGDSESIPRTVPVFNIFQTNDGLLRGAPIEQPNVENWDASGERGPANGEKGGRPRTVNHTNIDNSQAVLNRIAGRIAEAAGRSAAASSL